MVKTLLLCSDPRTPPNLRTGSTCLSVSILSTGPVQSVACRHFLAVMLDILPRQMLCCSITCAHKNSPGFDARAIEFRSADGELARVVCRPLNVWFTLAIHTTLAKFLTVVNYM